MNLYYSPKYEIDLRGHVFPTSKYRLIKELLTKQGIPKESFQEPNEAKDEDILLVHTKEYVEKLKTGTFSIDEIYKMEIPYQKEMKEPVWICSQGTISASFDALKDKIGIHIGGGFHHAYPDHGEGFCILNDHSIAIKKMLNDKKIKKAMVVDLDVHQGNGTAFIFRDENNVFTYSIHQEDNYPMAKEKSDLDIPLFSGTKGNEYLKILKETLAKAIETFKPDFIHYLAGSDPYEKDKLGEFLLSIKDLKDRDEIVLELVKKMNIPVSISFGGGYAEKIEDTVAIHANTVKMAMELF
jgi:acetoin utilization deacetylase AcuC-like enzyme